MPTATSEKFDNFQKNSDAESSSEEINSKNLPNRKDSKDDPIYTKVLEDSPFISGNEGPLLPLDDIPWLDMSKIEIGMAWFQEYFALYAVTTIIAMLSLAVAVKPISALIFRNDKPLKPDAYFRRFLGKLRGIEKFFTQLLDPVEAKKVFYKTRKLHEMALYRLEKVKPGRPLPEVLDFQEEQWMRDMVHAVKEDMKQISRENVSGKEEELPPQIRENLSWETQMPFNQFGMVYFTAGFFGSVWLRPQLFGMKDKEDIKMKGLIHVWAVIAKLLGLQDEFNIYINPDPELIDRICQDVYVDCLRNIDVVVIYLQSVVAKGIEKQLPLLPHSACLCLTMQAMGCERIDNMWKIMGVKDRVLFKVVQGACFLAGVFRPFRLFTNWLFKTFVESLYRKILDKVDDKYGFDD